MLGIAVAAIAAVNPLIWKTTTLELGEVKLGESVDLRFEFTNESDVPVTIVEAKGSCGCTDVKVALETINPGESSTITARFNAKSEGAFRKNIRVKTTASEEYTYLYFTGTTVN